MAEAFEGWVILELMGHRRLGGYVSEASIGGATCIRIDVPGDNGTQATQFYAPSALYCLTPTTEETARRVAKMSQPEPVKAWELPQLNPPPTTGRVIDAEFPEVEEDSEW
jgi:hypothetical protein